MDKCFSCRSFRLLERQYQTDIWTKEMVIDSFTGSPKFQGYRLTPLGRFLLRRQ